ncbi:MAG: hypothetical protein V9G29_05115 [Burkholderiaceae bacterium]
MTITATHKATPNAEPRVRSAGGESLDAGAVPVLPGGEGQHGGDDDAAVDEVDDRVGRGSGLVSEVAHELGGGRAAVDEQERDGDREQRDCEHGDADDGADEAGPVFAGSHDAAAEEEQPGHQQRVRDEGGDVGAAEERVDGGVDGVHVQGHRDGDGDRGVGDAAVGAFAAEDEQARHERPHERRDEGLDHPKTSE